MVINKLISERTVIMKKNSEYKYEQSDVELINSYFKNVSTLDVHRAELNGKVFMNINNENFNLLFDNGYDLNIVYDILYKYFKRASLTDQEQKLSKGFMYLIESSF